MQMTEITFKVNTRELQRQLNDLDLSKMTPTSLEAFIKKHIQVTLIGSNQDKRFYVNLDDKKDKVTVDDIIGFVHTDEPTDSVEEVRKLRGRSDCDVIVVPDRMIPVSEGLLEDIRHEMASVSKWYAFEPTHYINTEKEGITIINNKDFLIELDFERLLKKIDKLLDS